MNENTLLVVMITMFVRQHNQLARGLEAMNPHWDDERLYQESRRINVAMIQNVAYTEFVPAVIGERDT